MEQLKSLTQRQPHQGLFKKKKKELHATHYHRINGPGCNPQDNRVDKYEIEIFQLV